MELSSVGGSGPALDSDNNPGHDHRAPSSGDAADVGETEFFVKAVWLWT